RTRRFWTEAEDALLRSAILEGTLSTVLFGWSTLNSFVPGRTNKDCRKRWYGQME
ncbi:hypothetical protein DACRYDRAFT_52413, partial [Dacryopinax primogenitus]